MLPNWEEAAACSSDQDPALSSNIIFFNYYFFIFFFFTFLAPLPLEFKDFIVRNANGDCVVVEKSLGLQSAKRDKIRSYKN